MRILCCYRYGLLLKLLTKRQGLRVNNNNVIVCVILSCRIRFLSPCIFNCLSSKTIKNNDDNNNDNYNNKNDNTEHKYDINKSKNNKSNSNDNNNKTNDHERPLLLCWCHSDGTMIYLT